MSKKHKKWKPIEISPSDSTVIALWLKTNFIVTAYWDDSSQCYWEAGYYIEWQRRWSQGDVKGWLHLCELIPVDEVFYGNDSEENGSLEG